jgi:regulatory protein YycI of two-component signal transduction system YycFG
MAKWGTTEYFLMAFNICAIYLAYRFINFRLTSKLEEVENRQKKSAQRQEKAKLEKPL